MAGAAQARLRRRGEERRLVPREPRAWTRAVVERTAEGDDAAQALALGRVAYAGLAIEKLGSVVHPRSIAGDR